MECIEFNDLRDFYRKNVDEETFEIYLDEIYRELATSVGPKIGITKIEFTKYLTSINIFISEKIFSAFDTSKTGVLSYEEFSRPLKTLKYGTFEEVAKFIFDIYDFNSDGKVSTKDIKLLMCYLPLKKIEDNKDYFYQMESLIEIEQVVIDTFEEERRAINFDNFLKFLEKKANIFLLLVCYLYLNIPVFEKAMEVYKIKKKKSNLKKKNTTDINENGSGTKEDATTGITPHVSFKDTKSLSPKKKLNMTPTLFSPVTELYKRKFANQIPKTTMLQSSKRNNLRGIACEISNIAKREKYQVFERNSLRTKTNPINTLREMEKYDERFATFKENELTTQNRKKEELRPNNYAEAREVVESPSVVKNNGLNVKEEISIYQNENSQFKKPLRSSTGEENEFEAELKKSPQTLTEEMKRTLMTKKESIKEKVCSLKSPSSDLKRGDNHFLQNHKNSPLVLTNSPNAIKKSPPKSPLKSPIKVKSIIEMMKSDRSDNNTERAEEGQQCNDEKVQKEEKKSPQKIGSFLKDQRYNLEDIDNKLQFLFNDQEEQILGSLKSEDLRDSYINEHSEIVEAINNYIETYDEYLTTEEELRKSVLYEGELIKLKKPLNEVKVVYAVLIDRNIYFYNNKTDQAENYVKTHYLVGSFIRVNSAEQVGSEMYNSFTLFLQSGKQKKFFHRDNEVIKHWINNLRNAIKYRNLFDYYKIQSTIGEGQYGKVTLGINLETKEQVAIKIITKKKIKDKEVWEMIRTETDILKISKHPNIVNFIDNFENSDYIFIVMEYLKSGTLQAYLREKEHVISEKAVASISFQLADAFKYLHKFGIIHRDLKPENVMLVDKNVEESSIIVKITDFGFGKIMGSSEKTKEGYGTLGFVAPEVLLRVPYNNTIDIWSLGVMIFFMFNGDIPFKGKNKEETSFMICQKELVFPVKFKQMSIELLELIYSCLTKQPSKRISIDKVLCHPWFKKHGFMSK